MSELIDVLKMLVKDPIGLTWLIFCLSLIVAGSVALIVG